MVLFVALILIYPVWIWPFGAAILERFFWKAILPEMSQQERFQAEGWNAFITLVFGPPHPEISEMDSKSIAHYQQAGRPDLARRVEDIGQLLLWWKGVAFLAQFLVPILILTQIKPREGTRVLTVAWLLNAVFILYVVLFIQ